MITIRRIAILLTVTVFLTGCAFLESFIITQSDEDAAPPPIVSEATLPPALYILLGDEALPMNWGSHCWSTEPGVEMCADVAVFPPAYTPDMYLVTTGNTVALQFDEPFPDAVRASLYPVGGPETEVEATVDETGLVTVTVPDDVSGDYALLVFADWPEDAIPTGNSAYSIPLRFGP